MSTELGTDLGTDTGTGTGKIQPLIKEFNKTDRTVQKRTKKINIKNTLQKNRGLAVPIVFYICSQHGNAAEGHKPYQGKVYVDRFWKSVYQASGQPEFLIKAIEKYIARNDIKTIQWVMGPPVYMVTRPYCKHFFTPVSTLDVLTQVITPPKHNFKMLKPNDTSKYLQNRLSKQRKN